MDPLVFRLNPWVDLARRPDDERELFEWFDDTLLLFLGSACNLKCVYCFRPKELPLVFPVDALEAQIRRGRAFGCKRVILTGGEPLIHPDLDRVIDAVRAAGVNEFGVQTNAVKLADGAMVDRLVAKGLRFVHLSLDSADRETEDALTRHARTFDRVMAALEHLARHRDMVRVHVKAVITAGNADGIDDLVRLLARVRSERGLKLYFTLTPMLPPDSEYGDTLVRFDAIAPALAEGVDLGRRLGLRTFTHHIPVCVVGGRREDSIDWFSRDDVLLEDGRLDAGSVYTKSAHCAECPHEAECRGFPSSYASLFGDEIFRPAKSNPSDRRVPQPVRGPYAVSSRVVVGAMRGGTTRYWALKNIENRVEQVLRTAPDRVILAGPEPMMHPALPQIVSLFADRGLEVWIETLAIGFTRPEPIEMLAGRGLRGVRWLHLAPEADCYTRLLGKPLPDAFVPRVGALLTRAGIAIEHVFLQTAESAESLRGRIDAIRRVPWPQGSRIAVKLTGVPFAEKSSTWLGAAPADAPHAAVVAKRLEGLAQTEANAAFRSVIVGPE